MSGLSMKTLAGFMGSLNGPYSDTQARWAHEAEFFEDTRVGTEVGLDTIANPGNGGELHPAYRERQEAEDAFMGIRPGQRRAAARELLRSLRRAGATTPGGYARWLDSIGPDGRRWLDILVPSGGRGKRGGKPRVPGGPSSDPGRYAYRMGFDFQPVTGPTPPGVRRYRRSYWHSFDPVFGLPGVRRGARVGAWTTRRRPPPFIRVRITDESAPGGTRIVIRPRPTTGTRAPVTRRPPTIIFGPGGYTGPAVEDAEEGEDWGALPEGDSVSLRAPIGASSGSASASAGGDWLLALQNANRGGYTGGGVRNVFLNTPTTAFMAGHTLLAGLSGLGG